MYVGISDAKFSRDIDASLITYSLSSCVGIALYDPVVSVGGLLHYLLPDSGLDPAKAREHPWMFADIAIPMFFQWAYRLGAQKTRMRVMAAGGAQVLQMRDSLEIGRKNLFAMDQIFLRLGVVAEAEDAGGDTVRTLRLEIGSGRLMMRKNGLEERELCSQRRYGRRV